MPDPTPTPWYVIVLPMIGTYLLGVLTAWFNRKSSKETNQAETIKTVVARWNVAEDELRLKSAELVACHERIDALRADREKIRDQKHLDNEHAQEAVNALIKEYEQQIATLELQHQKECAEAKRCCDVEVTAMRERLKKYEG